MPSIRLVATVAYLNDGYPIYDVPRIVRVEDELNTAIAQHTLAKVKKFLREAFGPVNIVKTWPDNTYTFKRVTRIIQVDHATVNVRITTFRTIGAYSSFEIGGNAYEYSGTNAAGFVVITGQNHPILDGYSLWMWIERGQECPDCGTLHLGADEICDRCLSQYEARSYNHRVENELGMEDTKEIRFGVELEYEKVTAKDVFRTLKGHALPKRDGSIHEGVEVVTRPATMATHKKALLNFYDQIKVQPASNTGMHVHIERSKLSQIQIGFMMEFLNHRQLLPFITVVAGRDYANNTYCRINDSYKMTYGVYFDTSDWKLKRSHTDKYTPFNTAKEHTVEIRIFASPADHAQCAARLDFVSALVAYSSPYAVSTKTLKEKYDWKLFLDFIKQNRSQYRDFYHYYMLSNSFKEVSI
jgi:hypothetical protein